MTGQELLAREEIDQAERSRENDVEQRRRMTRALVAAIVLHLSILAAGILAWGFHPRRVDAPHRVSMKVQFHRPAAPFKAPQAAPEPVTTPVPGAELAPDGSESVPVIAALPSLSQATTVGLPSPVALPSPASGTGPIRVLPGEGPGLIKRVEPQYPPMARSARIDGTVVVDAVIRKDGSVSDVTVLSSTNRLFDQPCIDAVRQWRFSPVPQDVILTVTVMFTLR